MSGLWVCLTINPSYLRKGRDVLSKEIGRIFGDDLLELRVALDDDDVDPEELYAFVRCAKYFPYVKKLRESPAVRKVLSSYENPVFLSDGDVSGFIGSVETKKDTKILHIGDVVTIKDGYLSGLTGIVSERISEELYRISFKFHTRKFTEKMSVNSLEFTDNIFDHLKVPVIGSIDNLQECGIQWIGLTGIQFYGCRIKSVY